jgi:hypothetical protein
MFKYYLDELELQRVMTCTYKLLNKDGAATHIFQMHSLQFCIHRLALRVIYCRYKYVVAKVIILQVSVTLHRARNFFLHKSCVKRLQKSLNSSPIILAPYIRTEQDVIPHSNF